jgi:thioredoxin-dependent peroxiredoxin
MKKVEVGSIIPQFALKDQNGNLFAIDSVLGKKNLVIYFYPKDDSPGCTKEACSFRDQFEVFKEADAVIIGTSGQSVESHKEFAEKNRLKYPLVNDCRYIVRKLFGVSGRVFGLIPGRVTYVADKSGKVVYIFDSHTETQRHADEALKICLLLKKTDVSFIVEKT